MCRLAINIARFVHLLKRIDFDAIVDHLALTHIIKSKGLDPNIIPEKWVIKPIIASEVKGVSQNKPRLGQGRTGIKWKIKFPVSPPIDRPIVELKKPISQQPQNLVQQKITSNVPVTESSQIHDKLIPVPDIIIPQTRSGDDSSSRMIKRKNIQDIIMHMCISLIRGWCTCASHNTKHVVCMHKCQCHRLDK